jgi:hypothetical protein
MAANPPVAPGYPVTTVQGLVRAIKAHYAAVAAREEIAAPLIQFGRRHIEQIHAPPRIVIVPRKGPWGAVTGLTKGQVGSVGLVLEVHLWAPEPTIGEDELENELLRFDAADPMVDRFANVLRRVAAGRFEPIDLDPDAGQGSRAASVNHYGETYVLAFRFTRGIALDAMVQNTARPDPTTNPPKFDTPPGTPASEVQIDLTVEPN